MIQHFHIFIRQLTNKEQEIHVWVMKAMHHQLNSYTSHPPQSQEPYVSSTLLSPAFYSHSSNHPMLREGAEQ